MRTTVLIILVAAFVVLFFLKRSVSRQVRSRRKNIVDRMRQANLEREDDDKA
jgi:HAMP domain-containing protein